MWADFTALDLGLPFLSGWEVSTLVESVLFGTPDDVLSGIWVGGSNHHQPTR